MGLDRDRVLALQQRGLREWIDLMGTCSVGARTLELEGVTAAIIPATPKRSIPNSVSYTDAKALVRSLDDLAAAYAEAGVEAWTVWVPEFDAEAIEALTAAGHAFDGKPAAMALDQEGFDPPEVGELDWDAEATLEELGRVNDLAYGLAENGFGASLTSPSDRPGVRVYQARIRGETACVTATIDQGCDLGVYLVATASEFRGRGLASRLLTAALLEARERGLKTSSLQASGMGEPVYRRMGYLAPFRLHLYERRAS
jgi:ribosomal protein S18 acetylase RimI-like enzyme